MTGARSVIRRINGAGLQTDSIRLDVPPATQGDQRLGGLRTGSAVLANDPLEGPLGPLVSGPGPRIHLPEHSIERLAERWGRVSDGSLPCPVPGHSGRAHLVEDDGELRLGCCQGPARSLAEVRAAIAYRDDKRRTNKELAVWWRRLAFELEVIAPVEVDVPAVGDSRRPELTTARDGFALLLGLRRFDYPPEPVAYAVRFCAAWCQLTNGVAAQALRELRDRDVIRVVQQHGRTLLYEPGVGHNPLTEFSEPRS